jgi:tetratricopeptide (TPR) repeat protein
MPRLQTNARGTLFNGFQAQVKMTIEPTELANQGKRAFHEKKFDEAAELFALAANGFSLGRDGLMSAEMQNNWSVALLQAGRPQEALDAVGSSDEYFAGAKDIKRQAMALGNQAAALDALHRYDEAITKYERSADLFADVKDGDMRAMVLKSAAAIKLKTGKVTEASFKMLGSLDAKDKPSIFERFMRFVLRFIK